MKRSLLAHIGILACLLVAPGWQALRASEVAPAVPNAEATPRLKSPAGADASATLGQVRLDLSAVLQALFYKLQGREIRSPGAVAFAPSASDLRQDLGTELDLSGFGLKQISIRQDAAVGNDPLHRRIQVVYKMSDSLGRSLYALVAADYLIGDRAVLVRDATAVPYFPAGSDIRFMVMPASKLPALKFLKALPHDELFKLVVENSLSTNELKRIKPGAAGKFKLAAFNMARAEPGRVLGIYTSKDKPSGSAKVADAVSLDYGGWGAALVDGEFMFNTMPEFWFYVGMSDVDRAGNTQLLDRYISLFVQ